MDSSSNVSKWSLDRENTPSQQSQKSIKQPKSKTKNESLKSVESVNYKEQLDEDYEEARWREKERRQQDLPIEYWTLQKLVKFLKIGNQVVTNACLCCIRDFDLEQQLNQRAIFSTGGLEALVNLCKGNDFTCKFGALYVLRDMATNIDMRRYMIDMYLIDSLCRIISEPIKDIKCVAIDILGKLANVQRARTIIHKSGIVNKIIDTLNFDRAILKKSMIDLNPKQRSLINMAIASANALSKIFVSDRILDSAKKGGLILSLNQLLQTVHPELISAVLNLCNVCSRDIVIQLGLETEKIIIDVTKRLKSKETVKLIDACGILAQCGKSPQTSKLIEKNDRIKLIVSILSNAEYWRNDALMLAATAAAYTCAYHRENAEKFNKLGVLHILRTFLTQGFNDNILANICGFASKLLIEQKYVTFFLENDSLRTILEFFFIEHDQLRIELCHMLRKVCEYPEYARKMREYDGITFLWALLKSQNSSVQAATCDALCEYLKHDDESPEYLRKLDNGLELVARLLKSTDTTTLIAVCTLIEEIAKDSYNLAILTQYNVVPLLAELIHSRNPKLEEKVTAAIANCTPYADNAKQFGELKVIRLVVNLVSSNNPKVQRSAAMALEKLSAYPINAILIYQSGVTPVLLQDIHSNDPVFRSAATNCLRNIRELTLEAENFLLRRV